VGLAHLSVTREGDVEATATEQEVATPGQSRTIYMLNEDWAIIDAVQQKLSWKMSPVMQNIVRKFARENGTTQIQAVELLTFSMGWNPNDPASTEDTD
jgi:hypothetical protein